ncbi:MAG TPA: sulfatase [Solirubrobacteraceae bacterium]
MTRDAVRLHVERAMVLLAIALGGALVAATAAGLGVAREQRWLDAGYVRLATDWILARFDRSIALPAAGVLVFLVLALVLRVRMRPGPRLMRIAAVVLLLVVGLRVAGVLDAWRVRTGPNVLLISIDTLRSDHLGTYGSRRETSPTIDRRLAAEGVTFEDVYSQSPKTTPSHMTMLTSLYPCVHGIELWDGDTPGRALRPRVHTLAEVLKNAGYATAAFTGGAHMHRSRGFDQGFDVYKHSDQLNRTREWIAGHRRQKWFVFFHTYQVHDPYLPPADLIARFAPDYRGPVLEAVERVRTDRRGWDHAHQAFWASVDIHDASTVDFVERLYDAGIRHMDETTIAPLLDQLDRLDLARDTLIVFTSDHGEAFAEHGRFLHDDLYAGTLRVPLIVRFPGRLPAGTRVAHRARVLDVMPTVLALLGVPAPVEVQGESLVPFVAAARDGAQPATVSEYSNRTIARTFESLRRGPLAYIVDGPDELLFDVAEDGGEHQNIAPTRPAEVGAMRAELAHWRESCQTASARLGAEGETVAPDAETQRRLRALGYIR